METKSNAGKSPQRPRPVYLIGGGYNHKRNMSHSALDQVSPVGIHQIKETDANLTQLADYEGKIKNRVQYLEKEEKKMLAKMNIIKKRVDVRENAIKLKQQDQVRQALRAKRDEAIKEQRKNAVKEKMLQRQMEKNAIEEK